MYAKQYLKAKRILAVEDTLQRYLGKQQVYNALRQIIDSGTIELYAFEISNIKDMLAYLETGRLSNNQTVFLGNVKYKEDGNKIIDFDVTQKTIIMGKLGKDSSLWSLGVYVPDSEFSEERRALKTYM